MANVTIPAQVQQSMSNPIMSASLINNPIMNQIHSIHAPDGCSRYFDVKPLLRFTENILQNALPTIIDTPAIPQDAQAQLSALLEDYEDYDFLKLYLAKIIKRTSCKISCISGQSANAVTLEVFETLSSFTWETKVVIALAAFSVTHGKFWLVAQPSPTNLLAKSIAILEQLPDVLTDKEPWKPKFEAPSNLIKTILKVAKCIVEFSELPSQYMTPDGRGMPTAAVHIPTAVYWTIHGMVVCTKHTMCLTDMGQEDIDITMEDWYLSSLDHNLSQIHDYLKEQLAVCHQHIRERRDIEAYKMIEHLLKTPQIDNIKILEALICAQAEQLPLFDGLNKKRAKLDVLWKKNVLLLISELEVPYQELSILEQMYLESRQHPTREESQYEVVWLPVDDRSTRWNEEMDRHFETQKTLMTWYSVFHPSLLETAAIKYIKKVWGLNKKPMLVALDPMGRVVNPNAIHMIYIWGPTVAFPFSKSREEGLWKEVTWSIELLAATIHPMIIDWISEGKYICLFGGQDIEWIRRFSGLAKAVGSAADIKLEMLYVGKSNPREKVRENNDTIAQENLSHALPDLSLVWFFWARLESMWHSRVQHGENAERDPIMQEIMSILSFDGGDHGWAVFSRGWGEMSQMTKAKGDTIVKCLSEYELWKNNVAIKGFVAALNDHLLHQLQTPHHCNRLVLAGTTGRTPDRVACAECGRPMEKFIMYRCCTD